jgi:hypothetical protein
LHRPLHLIAPPAQVELTARSTPFFFSGVVVFPFCKVTTFLGQMQVFWHFFLFFLAL